MSKKPGIEQHIVTTLLSQSNFGIATFDSATNAITYENKCFSKWLPGDESLESRIPNLKLDKLIRSITRKGKFSVEKEIKENNRNKMLKIDFISSDDNCLVINVSDYSKEKEKEYLLDSYIRIAEKNKKELEESLALIKEQKKELQKTNADLEREKNSVELRMLQAVINPHFVSNSLSSIQGFIVEKNTDEAVNYLSHFGRLMRLSFEQSYFDYVAIEEILELLTTYVAIERMRMDQKWKFNLKVDERLNTSNSKIPPLLIQPFLENAIWHGINRKKSNGKISLTLELIDELMLKCTIEDNGLGRNHNNGLQRAHKQNKRVGLHSLNVTNKRLDILWQEHKQKHDIIYTDLKDKNGNAKGTKVELFIPINF